MTRWLGPALLGLLLIATSCVGAETIVSRNIIKTIPWDVPETTKYRVLDHNDNEVGTATFKIESEEMGLRFTQHFQFPGRAFVNDAQVVADAETLEPISTRFVIDGPDGRFTCESAYASGDVTAHRTGQDGERDDTLELPDIFYDSWTDLFLWRTIDYGEGFETEYGDVLSCTVDRTQKQNITLRVLEQESITTPLGTYDTWHLEIESAGETQDAWYSTDPLHLLVKYDNGDQTFELIQAPS
jgi:hypothetical protein